MVKLDQAYDIHSRLSIREICIYFDAEEVVEVGTTLCPEKVLWSMLCTGMMEQEMEPGSSSVKGMLER